MALQLQSVPAEVFERVIKMYVRADGPSNALTTSLVCKLMQASIKREILLFLPAKAIRNEPRAMKFVQKHLLEFLKYRLAGKNTLNGMSDAFRVILETVTQALQKFASANGCIAPSREELIEAAARSTPEGVMNTMVKSHNKESRSKCMRTIEETPAIDIGLVWCICLERAGLIQALLSKGANPWASTRNFHEAAIHYIMLHPNWTMFEDIKRAVCSLDSTTDLERRKRQKILMKTVQYAIDEGKATVAWQAHRLVLCTMEVPPTRRIMPILISALSLPVESFIVCWTVQMLRFHHDEICRRSLSRLVEIAIYHRRYEQNAIDIVDLYLLYFPAPVGQHKRTLVSWFRHAISRVPPREDLADHLITKSQALLDWDKTKGIFTQAICPYLGGLTSKIWTACLASGILRTTNKLYRKHEHDAAQSLLWHAVAAGEVGVARMVLEDMEKNCPTVFDESKAVYPYGHYDDDDAVLDKAIERNDTQALGLLLRYGFDPEGKTHTRTKSTYQTAPEGSGTARMIEQAVLSKKRNEGEEYRKPLYHTWREIDQAFVWVKYSLTPEDDDAVFVKQRGSSWS